MKKKEKKALKEAKRRRQERKLIVFFWKLFKQWEIRERIIKANHWASMHKKRTAVLTVSALSISLVIGILTSLLSIKNEERGSNFMNEIENVQPMFQGIRQINNSKAVQQEEYAALINRGEKIKKELDSLIALPSKSHDDSLKILTDYKQLTIITNNINNNEER